ncbi:hypothetical protein P691DRAFT_433556 [Macrolepiota fuliginosa MF-IS2]|uniref:DUF6533 domain-containing protein n=1 Tax=Macrolepiota fuliginosa MF-IS2 TaxID=1400762 RepID=A0A9P5XI41_9AGAR|nr:hypothetical protein P691DRAFT_433556 [Macrolepiota fuliginosa MF-IS2]
MATMVIVVYEWLITLDMEVRLIWQSKWNFTKGLYLLNRYLVIVDFVLNYFRSYGERVPICKALFQATAVVYTFALFVAEYSLAMRVCVVWKMNKIVVVSLTTVYTASFIWVLTSFYIMLRPIEFFTLLPFGGCLAKIGGSTLWIDYLMLLVYDAGMLALMAYPTIKEYKSGLCEHTDLVKHVYVEGVLFYLYLLLVDVVSVTVQLTLPDDIFLFVIGARMLRSILAARVLLHLREYAERKVQGVPTTQMGDDTEMSNIRFN